MAALTDIVGTAGRHRADYGRVKRVRRNTGNGGHLAAVILAIVSFALTSRQVSAGPALLFEADTSRIIFAEKPDQPWYPASLTKLMTAYVVFAALKRDKIDPKAELGISPRANAQPPSRVGLGAGKFVSIEEALAGLIIQSGNDLAFALAEAVSGSEAEFVAEMNETALRLGMVSTRFINPSGLPGEGQGTTARDMGILAQALLRDFPEWAYLYALKTATVGPRTVGSHNEVLATFEGADGMKTGFTCGAGYNVVASATRDGRRIIAVVLGERSSPARAVRAERLLGFGFAATPRPGPEAETIDRVPVHGEALVDVALFDQPRLASESQQIRNCWPPGKAPPRPVVIATAPPSAATDADGEAEGAADAKAEANSGKPGATAAPTTPVLSAAPAAGAAGSAVTAAVAATAPTSALPSSVAAKSVGPAAAGPPVQRTTPHAAAPAKPITAAASVPKAPQRPKQKRPSAAPASNDDDNSDTATSFVVKTSGDTEDEASPTKPKKAAKPSRKKPRTAAGASSSAEPTAIFGD